MFHPPVVSTLPFLMDMPPGCGPRDCFFTCNMPSNALSKAARGAPGGGSSGLPRCPDGAIAQLGERLNGIQEVGGSTPPGSTITVSSVFVFRAVFPL